jgi:hypothetical protein
VTIWGTHLGQKVPVTQYPVNGSYNTGSLGGTYVYTNINFIGGGDGAWWASSANPAVILYASDTQVNIILPYLAKAQAWASDIVVALQPPSSSAIVGGALNYGPLLAKWDGPIRSDLFVDSAPRIFSTPNGMAEAVNQNGSINAPNQPAHRGDIISLYATGEGQTTPAGVDGKLATVPLPRPKSLVTVTIGGQPVQVLYAGGAPGLVAGLMQVNVQIPPLMSFASSTPILGSSAPGGTVYAVSVVLTVGTGENAVSPTANIAVQ